jgi:hypothetical protein
MLQQRKNKHLCFKLLMKNNSIVTIIQLSMKKQFLKLTFVATIISAVAISCSSSEKATSTDSVSTSPTTTDTSKMMSTPADTTRISDTSRKM